MDKSKVLAKLEEYKDRPIEITIDGANDMTFYGNIEGHWLFDGGDFLVHVVKNVSNGKYEIANLSQREKPFAMHMITYDAVKSIRTYIDKAEGAIKTDLGSFTPIGTSKSITDVLNEIESDSIRKVSSPSGYLNVKETAPNGAYGKFNGSYISTTKEGIPQNVRDELLNSNNSKA
jgi:hypothetical protein